MAPGVGFEPTSLLPDNGLASHRLTRLGNPGFKSTARKLRSVKYFICKWCGSPPGVGSLRSNAFGHPASIPFSCERHCPGLGLLPSGPNPFRPASRRSLLPDGSCPLQHPHRARLPRCASISNAAGFAASQSCWPYLHDRL